MVEENNITSPPMRMQQFSRCALGGMDGILKTTEDSSKMAIFRVKDIA